MKKCSKCGIEKDESEFYKKKITLDCWCKQCNKQYRQKNKEHRKELQIEWNKNNTDYNKKYRESNKQYLQQYYENWKKDNQDHLEQYRINNKETIKKYSENWRNNNRKRIKEWHIDNSAKISKQRIIRKRIDPIFKLKCQIRIRIYKSLNKQQYTKDFHTYELLQCSYEDFQVYLGPKPSGIIHLDHICPCAQAKTEEELIKLQHYSNFRWLDRDLNIEKSDKWTPEGEELCKKLLGREWIH